MRTPASSSRFPSALRWMRVLACVTLLVQLLLPVVSSRAGALADDASVAESTAEPSGTDTTAPVVTVPEIVIVTANPATGGAIVNFDTSAMDDVDGSLVATCDWPSGSFIPIGTTAVTCVALDVAGNEGSAMFDVTVDPAPDTTAPEIGNVPADIEVNAEDDSGTTVTYDLPVASDDVDGALPVECAPNSGSPFPIGSTVVTCSATDSSGNRAEASFIVTVLPLPTVVATDFPTQAPTDTPTVAPTDTPSPKPTITPTSTPTTPPTITSNKEDYAPGEAVALTGEHWQPGEVVHINVNDDEGQTWKRDVDVVADEYGTITDSFNLPDWFVATYTVKATGAQSGPVTATFTDSISFSGTGTNSNGAGATSITVSRPGSVVAGDSLVAQITFTGGTSVVSVNPPTGWSLAERTNNGTTIGQAIFLKVAGASEPVSYSFSFGSVRRAAGAVTAYQGTASVNPYAASASASGTGLTLTAPSANILIDPERVRSYMVVTFFGIAANATLSTPASMTQRYLQSSSSPVPSIMGSDIVQWEAGPTGTRTSASDVSGAWISHTLVLEWVQIDTRGTGGVPAASLIEDIPADATEGDLLLANIMTRNGSASITAPAGWTLIAKRTNTGTDLVTEATYWRIVGPSEPATYTWTFSTPIIAVGGIIAYADIDPVNPIDAFASNPPADSNLASSSSLRAPALTTTSANAIIVTLYAVNGNGSIAPPSGMLTRYNFGSGNSRLAAHDVKQTIAGPSGDKVAGGPGTVRYVAQTIALRPKSTGPTKLAFATAALSGAVNDCLGPITIETRNASDVPTNVLTTTVVNLASDGTGAFFSDGSCAVSTGTDVTFAVGSNTGTFFYRPTNRGTGSHTLSASATGLTSAAQAQSVGQASQSISFATLVDQTYGDAPLTVSATGGGSGNPVIFAVGATDACTSSGINGAMIAISGAGSCTVTASQAGNDDYSAAISISQTFLIATKQLTGSFTADNKIYDGTTSATVATRSIAGTVGTDDVSLTGGTANFDDKHVGTDKRVTLIGATLSGADAGNYNLTSVDSTTADVTAKTASVTPNAATKTYGSADPDLSGTMTGFLAADDVTATYSRAAGETVGFYSISATLAPAGVLSNYDVTFSTAELAITRKVVTGDFSSDSKIYDGTTSASIAARSLTGVEGTDDVTLMGGTASFADANVGIGKVVTGTGFILSGADQENYHLTSTTLTTTADITLRPITVKADDRTKVLGAVDPALTYAVTSGVLVPGDSISGALTRDPGEGAGSYLIRQGTLALSSNYSLTVVSGTLTITYGFDGFLQPINYTAHQTGGSQNTSLFKAGSTVPVKFELKDATGTVVPCAGGAIWLGSVKGGPITTGVNELSFTDPATPGGSYTCSNGQYHYNWSTKGLAAGFYYRIGVRLSDGQTYYVYIGLK